MNEKRCGHGSTYTVEGDIPHAVHPRTGMEMPVRISLNKLRRAATDQHGRPYPEKTRDGQLVYALPGGGRWVFPAKP